MFLSPRIRIEENLKIVGQTTHTRFPLGTIDDHVAGMIHVKDQFIHRTARYGGLIDQNDILFVPEAAFDALLREFQQSRTHMAIVVDEYGGTAA